MLMCSRCHKRPAVVFISQSMDTANSQGLCLVCAKELGIKPVNDLMEKMGITEDQLEAMTEEMNSLMAMDSDTDENGEEGDEDGFTPGGAATFPSFLQNIFPGMGQTPAEEESVSSKTKDRDKKPQKKNKRKHIAAYCTDLTARARAGELDAIIGR